MANFAQPTNIRTFTNGSAALAARSLVKFASNGTLEVADAADDRPIGVTLNNISAPAGADVDVAIDGVVVCSVGNAASAISPGSELACSTGGTVNVATVANIVFGIALTSNAASTAGEVEVLLRSKQVPQNVA